MSLIDCMLLRLYAFYAIELLSAQTPGTGEVGGDSLIFRDRCGASARSGNVRTNRERGMFCARLHLPRSNNRVTKSQEQARMEVGTPVCLALVLEWLAIRGNSISKHTLYIL